MCHLSQMAVPTLSVHCEPLNSNYPLKCESIVESLLFCINVFVLNMQDKTHVSVTLRFATDFTAVVGGGG